MSAAALLSVFLIALLGGVHCLAMCSGIALAAERAQPAVRIVSRRRLWFEQLVMHLGRLTTYALLGAAMGALGATVWRQQWLPIQRGLFALASALLLAYGLLLLSRTAADVWRGAWLERILGRLSGGLAAVASGVRASSLRARFPLAGRYLTGLAWGLVPCGMVYGALAVALLAGKRGIGGGGHAGVRRGHAAEPADDVGRGRMVAWRVADALGSRCRGHRNRRIRHLGTRVCRVAARDAQRTWILPGTLTLWPDIRGGGAAGFAVRRYSRLRPRRNMAYNQPQFDSPPVAQIKIPSAAIGEAVWWPSRPGLSIRAGRRSSEAAVRCSSRPHGGGRNCPCGADWHRINSLLRPFSGQQPLCFGARPNGRRAPGPGGQQHIQHAA